MFSRPWLPRTHPNFFLMYLGTIVFNVWAGWNGIFGPASLWSPDVYDRVFDLAPADAWGAANVVIAVGLFAGLFFQNFTTARIFLGLGGIWIWTRFFLIGYSTTFGGDPGNLLPLNFICGVIHMGLILEPPVNPASARGSKCRSSLE